MDEIPKHMETTACPAGAMTRHAEIPGKLMSCDVARGSQDWPQCLQEDRQEKAFGRKTERECVPGKAALEKRKQQHRM